MKLITTSDQGIELIKRVEGCAKKLGNGHVRAYQCPAGEWTIGYGHTEGVYRGMTITQERAEELLQEDLRYFERVIARLVKPELSQTQFDALVSFVFNVGEGNFRTSTLLRKLNKNDFDGAALEFPRWNKSRVEGVLTVLPGLVRRRAAEAALFTHDIKLAGLGGAVMPQNITVDPVGVATKPLRKSRSIWGSVLAATGVAGSFVTGNSGELSSTVDSLLVQLAPFSGAVPYLTEVTTALTVSGILLAAYARWDDHRKSLR